MNENTTEGEKMDRDRIAELRLLERHLRASGQMAGAVIGELLDALSACGVDYGRERPPAHEVPPSPELADLLRKRYPRLLERGNPLYDGVLAAAVERAGSADVVTVLREELAVLREIVHLLDEARQRYDKHPRGAGGQRMPDEIDDLLCRLYEMGAHPALRAAKGGEA